VEAKVAGKSWEKLNFFGIPVSSGKTDRRQLPAMVDTSLETKELKWMFACICMLLLICIPEMPCYYELEGGSFVTNLFLNIHQL